MRRPWEAASMLSCCCCCCSCCSCCCCCCCSKCTQPPVFLPAPCNDSSWAKRARRASCWCWWCWLARLSPSTPRSCVLKGVVDRALMLLEGSMGGSRSSRAWDGSRSAERNGSETTWVAQPRSAFIKETCCLLGFMRLAPCAAGCDLSDVHMFGRPKVRGLLV
eukprot:1158410-Pelagomonas_calceolata.AAC.3